MKINNRNQTKKCRYCGKLFTLDPNRDPRGRQPMYCSEECRTKWRREYALRVKWSNIDQVRKNDIEYHKRIREDRQKNGIYFKYDKVDEMIQKVLDLELYRFQMENVFFKVPYKQLTTSFKKDRLANNLDKIESLNLSTEYLSTHESFEENDFEL